MLRVSILGAGSSYPPPGYAGPCIIVDLGGETILLDAGESCASRLGQLGVSPCEVENVYISHRHIDHWAGLHSIAIGRVAGGCKGGMRIIAPWLEEDPVPEGLSLLVDRGHATLTSEPPSIAGARVEPVRVRHEAVAYGLRVSSGGRAVFYTSDTMLFEGLVEEARGSTLLIAEATLPEGIDPVVAGMHMRVSDALE
ncbi:MAG: ribonuclease Z, partial [Desulfurococcales archaeon]|nr:ribonuclease Z [Desulfurococcales archaeon]